jgi:hypothetical protein
MIIRYQASAGMKLQHMQNMQVKNYLLEITGIVKQGLILILFLTLLDLKYFHSVILVEKALNRWVRIKG